MSVQATGSPTEPTDEALARGGAVAYLVIALAQVVIGLLVPAANGIYALASTTVTPLLIVPWWVFVIVAVALGVLLALTWAPSRQYLPTMHGKLRLFNTPFAIASLAIFWAVVSLLGTATYKGPQLFWIAAVISLCVAIAGAVIDYRQGGVIPFFIKGFALSFGAKNRENRKKTEHEAAVAYAKIPKSARLPVLTRAGRWAIAPLVTLLVTVLLAVAGVVTPLYVVLGLIGGVSTGLLLVVILHNVYARGTGVYLDLPTPYVSSYHYLPDDVRKAYNLRWSGQGVGFVSGFVELAAFAICVAAWLVAVIFLTPIF